jgi:serine/threonine protein kinase
MHSADLLLKLRAALPREYAVDAYVDQGGQGTVFKGTFQGRRAALKLFGNSPDMRRIERELHLLSSVTCDNLISMYGSTTVVIDGSVFPVIAYEYLDGGDLRQYLAPTAAPMVLERLLQVAIHVGTAIEALWKVRICHRDIKPGNIVQASISRFVLVDVGFARHLDRSNITLVGTPGTMGYMSPEQARGRRDLTIRSDVFSLGTTLYELAAKRHPFDHNQAQVGSVPPPSLAALRPDLPASFAALIHQMMAVPLTDRPISIVGRLKTIGGVA